MTILIYGHVTVTVPIKCSKCWMRARSSHHAFVNGVTADELEDEVKTRVPNIPEGWLMNGRSDLRCPSHHKGA